MWNIFNIPHEIEEAETSLIKFYEFEDKNTIFTTKNILIEIKEEEEKKQREEENKKIEEAEKQIEQEKIEALRIYGKIKCIHCPSLSMEYFSACTFFCEKCKLKGNEISSWAFICLLGRAYETCECHCNCGNRIIKEYKGIGSCNKCYKTTDIQKLIYDNYIESKKPK